MVGIGRRLVKDAQLNVGNPKIEVTVALGGWPTGGLVWGSLVVVRKCFMLWLSLGQTRLQRGQLRPVFTRYPPELLDDVKVALVSGAFSAEFDQLWAISTELGVRRSLPQIRPNLDDCGRT